MYHPHPHPLRMVTSVKEMVLVILLAALQLVKENEVIMLQQLDFHNLLISIPYPRLLLRIVMVSPAVTAVTVLVNLVKLNAES